MSSFATPKGAAAGPEPREGAIRSLRMDGAEERGPEGAPWRAVGRDAEHKEELVCVMPGAPRGVPTVFGLFFSESLILAQNERWQRGLGMQVERDPEGSNVGR